MKIGWIEPMLSGNWLAFCCVDEAGACDWSGEYAGRSQATRALRQHADREHPPRVWICREVLE